jgi:hypothetical protein
MSHAVTFVTDDGLSARIQQILWGNRIVLAIYGRWLSLTIPYTCEIENLSMPSSLEA